MFHINITSKERTLLNAVVALQLTNNSTYTNLLPDSELWEGSNDERIDIATSLVTKKVYYTIGTVTAIT